MIHISAKKVFEHQYIYYGRYKLFTRNRQFLLRWNHQQMESVPLLFNLAPEKLSKVGGPAWNSQYPKYFDEWSSIEQWVWYFKAWQHFVAFCSLQYFWYFTHTAKIIQNAITDNNSVVYIILPGRDMSLSDIWLIVKWELSWPYFLVSLQRKLKESMLMELVMEAKNWFRECVTADIS